MARLVTVTVPPPLVVESITLTVPDSSLVQYDTVQVTAEIRDPAGTLITGRRDHLDVAPTRWWPSSTIPGSSSPWLRRRGAHHGHERRAWTARSTSRSPHRRRVDHRHALPNHRARG
jgi:hypothetical protein